MIYLALTVAMPCTLVSVIVLAVVMRPSACDAVATVLHAMTGTISAIVPWPTEIRSQSVDVDRSEGMPSLVARPTREASSSWLEASSVDAGIEETRSAFDSQRRA